MGQKTHPVGFRLSVNKGWNSIWFAEKNNFSIVKLLLDKNIDLSISDFTGRTLREISESSRDKRILKLLNEKS